MVQNVVDLNDVMDVTVATPFVDWTKSDILKNMIKMDIPYNLTWTCYEPKIEDKYYVPCKVCQACVERENTGVENKVSDINKYKIRN